MNGATQPNMYRVITAIDAATATTTSGAIDVAGAKKISLMFTRSNHSSGSTAFTVEVSLDGTTFVAYNKMISNVTNTNAQTLTRVASVSLASNTSAYVTLDPMDAILAIKVTATETTDGTHTAKVMIEN